MLIGWTILGALIGWAASQKRGFNPIAGVLGGLLLGPFAILMYFVSGVGGGVATLVKCPHCAESVKAEAQVCRHCRLPLGVPSAKARTV